MTKVDATKTIYEECWDAHVGAHDVLDLEGVVATYADDATVQEYNSLTKELNIYKGKAEIREFFKVHLATVSQDGTLEGGHVNSNMHFFPNPPPVKDNTLTVYWDSKSPTTTYSDDADTFVFKEMPDGTAKIHFHFQFLHKSSNTGKTIYEDCWQEHVDAYVAKDPAALAAGYSKDCILQEFDARSGHLTIYNGRAGVEEFFTNHFKTLLNEDGTYCDMTMIPAEPKVKDNTMWLSFTAKSATTYYKNSSDSITMKAVEPGIAKISFHYMHVNIVPLTED